MKEAIRKKIEPKVPLIKYNNPNPKEIRKSLYIFNLKFKKLLYKDLFIFLIYHYISIQRNL